MFGKTHTSSSDSGIGWTSHRRCSGPGCDGSCGRVHTAPAAAQNDEEEAA